MTLQREDIRQVARVFLPTPTELISLFILSFLALVLINSFSFLRTVEGQNYTLVIEYIQIRVREALTYVDGILGPTIPLVILWMFIGMIVYLILWFMIGAWRAWREDLPPDGPGMIVPKEYSHAKGLRRTILRILLRTTVGVLLLVWFFIFFASVLPKINSMFLEGSTELKRAWLCLVASALLAGSLFIMAILARCLVMRTRVFESDAA